MSRPVATSPDSDFTLTIDEALGALRPRRTPPHAAQRPALLRQRPPGMPPIETAFGEKYLISPESVDKHIAYIEEVRQATTSPDLSRHAATSRDVSRQVAHNYRGRKPRTSRDRKQRQAPTCRDLSRQSLSNNLKNGWGRRMAKFNFSDPRSPSRTIRSKT